MLRSGRTQGADAGLSVAVLCHARSMADRPSGTVTFLFTDIEGSTPLWDSYPVAMGEALARHDEILRSAIDAQAGYVFSTGGDGLAAVFSRAGLPLGWLMFLIRGVCLGKDGHHGKAISERVPR